MSDPNLTDFHSRVLRLKKARANGYGFEAPGTLGRSHYYHLQTQRRSIFGPILFLLICAFLIKGMIYYEAGAESYNSRVAVLMAGQGFDHIGGWLMQADPVTLYVSDTINLGVNKLKSLNAS